VQEHSQKIDELERRAEFLERRAEFLERRAEFKDRVGEGLTLALDFLKVGEVDWLLLCHSVAVEFK
jgi:hypothetical protein